MAKIVLDNITGGYDLSKINANFDKIETALENTLSRDGTAPNSMSADFDMNGKGIINSGLLDVSSLYISGQPVLPSGVDLDARLPEVLNYTSLRAYNGPLTSFYVQSHTSLFDGGAGVFRVDAADTTSADNGGTLLVDALGRRWKREFSGAVNVLWFGAVGNSDGIAGNGADNAAAFLAAIAVAFASSTRPRKLFVPDGWYRLTAKLPIPTAHWQLEFESHRAILWLDHNDTGIEATNAGNYAWHKGDVRRVSGKTGTNVKILQSPEGLLDDVYITGGSDALQIQDSHLTTLRKCRISGATSRGINDLGRCFGSQLDSCNIIGNANGADLKSDWQIYGGAIEQNTASDLLISTTADYEGKYWGWVNIKAGCHMEGLSGGAITSDQIVVGPSGASVAGPTAKIGLMISGSFVLGNSANRTAINFRQGDLCSVSENYFKNYQAGATLIRIGAACTGALLQGNRWDGTGTFKDINVSATNVLDFETENTAHASQVMSLTHSLTNGGRLRGVNTISSAARSMNLTIESRRDSSNSEALSLRTAGVDNVTLFTRMAASSGADVGVVTFPSARVEVPGSSTAPFKIGTAFFWVTSGKLYIKDGATPTTPTDGTVVGTQT